MVLCESDFLEAGSSISETILQAFKLFVDRETFDLKIVATKLKLYGLLELMEEFEKQTTTRSSNEKTPEPFENPFKKPYSHENN